MSVELPKDATGHEIPLDTVTLFNSYGDAYNIVGWMFDTDFLTYNKWANSWRAFSEHGIVLEPEKMYLIPPDSWEKLEEDLGRAAERDVVPTGCRYFNATNKCAGCPLYGSVNCDVHRDERAFENIISRIRKLRSED